MLDHPQHVIMSDSHHHHSGPYYSYLIQTNKNNGAGDWHRWLVCAASRQDMKTFFRGLQKYTKTPNAKITEVNPTNLAWWTFDAPEGFNVREIVKAIYRSNPAWYNDVPELTKSVGKITVTVLSDAGGRDWPIFPPQNTSMSDF